MKNLLTFKIRNFEAFQHKNHLIATLLAEIIDLMLVSLRISTKAEKS